VSAAPDAGARADAVRRSAGLFRLAGRAVISVEGGDARRWLNGMVSNDVTRLAASGPERHCHALLLTPIGRVFADLWVVARPEGFWLDLERFAVPAVLERLAKYVIADDVRLGDLGASVARLALEGPATPAIAARARDALARAGALTAEYGWSGESALQLFVPAEGFEATLAALRASGGELGLAECDEATLEVLRVESGTPRFGAELGEDVLPPEARLDAAVSTTKGCYTGQEVIARIRSRGQVKHLLVGLRLEGDALPEPRAPIEADGKRIGEVTSAVRSAQAGAIALGFVARSHAEPGTRVQVAGRPARVAELPFVRPGA
jgi:folate-binding protein YgfZ